LNSASILTEYLGHYVSHEKRSSALVHGYGSYGFEFDNSAAEISYIHRNKRLTVVVTISKYFGSFIHFHLTFLHNYYNACNRSNAYSLADPESIAKTQEYMKKFFIDKPNVCKI
jgi:hypothetical protein